MLRSLVDAVPLPLILVGPDQSVVTGNDAARALFGEVQEGRHVLSVVRAPDVLAAVEAVLQGGQAREVALRLPAASHEARYGVHCRPVRDEVGGRLALLAFVDRSDVEQAGAIRRDFVANVSHELRSPLTALLGFIETLRGPARDDVAARERFLGIMQREAERMNRMVSDLMSLTRVEAEERVRPSAPVDVRNIVRASIAALRPVAEAAGAGVRLTGDEAAAAVPGDGDQLTQVFHNLIENALKYGATGGEVTVAITRVERDPVLRGAAVRIDVVDRGEGIDPIHLPRLTERFYRVDSHRSRAKGGTGLGLAIVKHIVIRHRGRLLIDSTRGQGSRFSVILPAADAANAGPPRGVS